MSYPERCSESPTGAWWPAAPPLQLPKAQMVVHEHTTPSGVQAECRSQWLTSLGHTLDHWFVSGIHVAHSVRFEEHTIRPDFGWIDERCSSEAA